MTPSNEEWHFLRRLEGDVLPFHEGDYIIWLLRSEIKKYMSVQ